MDAKEYQKDADQLCKLVRMSGADKLSWEKLAG
jgi:hypothetical protein